METPRAAYNCREIPTAEEILTSTQAMQTLAAVLKDFDERVDLYWWKLTGDEPNSLCRLLDIEAEEMNEVLRLCKILYGPNDSLRQANFETVIMGFAKLDFSTYRPRPGCIEKFIPIGRKGNSVMKPKDMCTDGELEVFPERGKHIPDRRTKQLRTDIDRLLVSCNRPQSNSEAASDKKPKESKEQKGLSSCLSDVMSIIRKEIEAAGGRFTQRLERQLTRELRCAVSAAGRELLESVVERLAGDVGIQKSKEATPDRIQSVAIEETPVAPRQTMLVTPANDNSDVQVEEPDIVDPFIQQLKEDALLQSLLHKRLHEKKERFFVLEHRNGRKLRVVLPPDNQSMESFVDEAKKSRWVDFALPREEHVNGMLLCLKKEHADAYRQIGNRLVKKEKALDTEQTMACARLMGLNNAQLKKGRSYLNHIGKVELKYTTKKISEIDKEVGVGTEEHVQYGTAVYEWATSGTKGKEKRPPETCPFWNADALKEVSAEIDLHLKHRFDTEDQLKCPPLLDYLTPGFEKAGAGIVCLIGGDHGDQACPMSIKLNLTSPTLRKTMKKIIIKEV